MCNFLRADCPRCRAERFSQQQWWVVVIPSSQTETLCTEISLDLFSLPIHLFFHSDIQPTPAETAILNAVQNNDGKALAQAVNTANESDIITSLLFLIESGNGK